MILKWVSHSENPCPSCAALNGQIHTDVEWENFGVTPGDHELYCGEHCTCTMLETEEPEQGTLGVVPLRTSALVGSEYVASTDQVHKQGETMQDFTLQLSATPTNEGFDILAINAGEAKGHGISFGREVLMQSMEMFNTLPVFIDHAGFGNSPSVRNLAGTLQMPAWNEEHQGIQVKLKASGPAADVLLALREAAKTDIAIMQAVGFSCVVNVQLNKQGQVTKIVRVKSVDVVIDPARGGRFLSVHSGQKEKTMTNQNETEQAQLTETQSAALELQGANEAIAELQSKQKQANDMLLAQCVSLLETSLNASKLPAASQKAIRKPFQTRIDAGEPFTAVELQTAITEKREELSEISAGNNVQGPGRASYEVGLQSKDQFRLAVSDLFGMERETEEKNIRVHRLTGIREAYLMGTGDEGFMGGYYPEFALVTANFPSIVANVMNKMLVKAWQDYDKVYGWWKKVTGEPEHFNNLNDVTWVRTGTIASLPSITERGEYPELPIGDNKETSTWGKNGGYIPITIEAILRDDLRAFKNMPRQAALAGIRNISELVAAIFTVNSGAGPTMNDTGALFNSTAQTTAGGHLNLLTTALGTDYTAWNLVATAMFKKKLMVKNAAGYYGTGKPQGLKPSICLVPADLIAQAEALFVPRWSSPQQNIPATASVRWGGTVDPVAVPEWTDATDWAAVIDPSLVEGVKIGEIFGVMPQIFSASSEIDPAMFANDESRIKVRQFLTVGVADDMPLSKNNVAG